jgi:hypothetical protein
MVAGLPGNTPVGGPDETAPDAGSPDDTLVDGPFGAASVGGSSNAVPTASVLSGTAVNDPPAPALVVGLPGTAPVDDSQDLPIDEGDEWTFPPWSLRPDSIFPRITPEEEERAEALLRQLLDRTRGKPWRIGTKFIAKTAAGRLRMKPGKLVNRGKVVMKIKYFL